MWRVLEHRRVDKQLQSAPGEVLKRYEKWKMKDYKPAQKRIDVSVGESLRIIRELQELKQSELAVASGIAPSTIAAIENDTMQLGIEAAKQLARALQCHPAVLVFPGWDIEGENAA